MAATTPRFGLNWFDDNTDGDFTDDGLKFSGEDRLTIDSLFRALEKHDHHIGTLITEPVAVPEADYDEGGVLEGATDYFYVVSFVDTDGLETIAGPETSVSTPGLLDEPQAPFAETTTVAGGTLDEGVYYYALSALKAEEESPQSDFAIVTVLDDDNSVTLTLPALGAATSLQVWRQKETDPGWTRVGTTTSTTFVDDGSVPAAEYGDPNSIPPDDTTGSDTYLVTVTLTGDDLDYVQSGKVSAWRLYRATTSGLYDSASLIHEVVEREDDLDDTSPLLTSWTDDGDEPLTGSPKLVSTQLAISPYTFENASVLPATTGYPNNYPILGPGDALYYNKNGVWTALSGGGSGGGSINYEGPWAAGTYNAGTLVNYNNALWLSNASTSTVPGSQAGGYPLTLTTVGESYGQSVSQQFYKIYAVAQAFRNDGDMSVTSVQLYFDGNQLVGRHFYLAFCPAGHRNQTDYSTFYTGTLPAGTGWKSFTLPHTYALAANTDTWLQVGNWYDNEATIINPGLGLCLAADQPTSSGLTLLGNTFLRDTGSQEFQEDPGNDPGEMLCFKLVGTSAVVDEWDRLASLVPAAASTGQVLTSTGSDPGEYAWAAASGGGGGGGSLYRVLDSSVVASDPGPVQIFTDTIPIGPGETWDIEANLLYSPGYGNIEWYLAPELDLFNSATLPYVSAELWYPDPTAGTLVKYASGATGVGTGDGDGGPIITMTGDGFQSPVKVRFLVTNIDGGGVTVAASIALSVVTVIDPGASIAIVSGSFLRATQVA